MDYQILNEVQAAKDENVWVMNTSGNVKINNDALKASDIILTITTPSGKSSPAKIPPTFIPVNLGVKFGKENLLSSLTFRAMISKGLLTLIRHDDAMALLKEPGAAAEIERLRDLELGNIHHAALETDAIDDIPTEMLPEITQSPEQQQMIQQASETNHIDMMVQELVLRANAPDQDLKDSELMSSLRSNRMSLTRDDLEYVVANCPHPAFSDTMRWINTELMKLAAEA